MTCTWLIKSPGDSYTCADLRVQVMINALEAMGAGPFNWDASGRVLTLKGLGGRFQARNGMLWTTSKV